MRPGTTLALATALGAGLFASAAGAQDMRAFDEIRGARAADENAARVRFTLPFGQSEANREAPRMAFGFSRALDDGQRAELDVLSFSLAGPTPRLETPLALGAADDGDRAWYQSPRNLLLLGVGLGVAWAIYDHNQDDDDEEVFIPD
ncbi:MAG: hypothetical protein J0L81_03730 [Caulobacterales bacterium]|nr:hypothetical protein [Caulobacterales bacterium]